MRVPYTVSDSFEALTVCPCGECIIDNGDVVTVKVASAYCTEECDKFLDEDDENMTVECKGDRI